MVRSHKWMRSAHFCAPCTGLLYYPALLWAKGAVLAKASLMTGEELHMYMSWAVGGGTFA
jgi:hypothetical protein